MRVVVTDPIHVAHWGVFVSTPEISSGQAKISVHTRVANESSTLAGITVQTTVTGPAGGAGGSAQSALSVAPASVKEEIRRLSGVAVLARTEVIGVG